VNYGFLGCPPTLKVYSSLLPRERGLRLGRGFITFALHFLVYSLLATVIHEYFHFMVLSALGGEGELHYGIGALVFPWDEAHIHVKSLPPDVLSRFAYHSGGGALTVMVLAFLYFNQKELPVKAGLELAILPQMARTLAEPLVFMPETFGNLWGVTELIPLLDLYHTILFSSWLVGVIHLVKAHRISFRMAEDP